MAMSVALIIAVPAAAGLSLIVPKKSTPALTFLLASLSAASGITGLKLAREGKFETAMTWDIAAMMFSLLSLAKSLGLI